MFNNNSSLNIIAQTLVLEESNPLGNDKNVINLEKCFQSLGNVFV